MYVYDTLTCICAYYTHPYSCFLPYYSGSCLSGLALEGSHDVDISIYIPELHKLRSRFDNHDISGDNYHQSARKIIFRVRDALLYYRGVGFFDLVAITRARVPLIKGSSLMKNPHTLDGHLSFDLWPSSVCGFFIRLLP